MEEEIVPITPPVSPTPAASTSHGYVTSFRPSTSHTTPPYTIGPGQPPHWGHYTPGSPSPGAYTSPSSYPKPSTFPYPNSPSRPPTSSTSSATRPLEPLPAIVQRKRKITKNYVVLENSQTEKAPRVTWKQTMEGMFGDHVKWEDLRVYSMKNRPICKLVSFICVKLVLIHATSARPIEMSNYGAGREILGPTNRCPIRKCLCIPGDQQDSRARLCLERGVWMLRRARRGSVRRR